MTVNKTRTFDPKSYLSDQSVKATSILPAYTDTRRPGVANWTTTYATKGRITPVETAPPSVEDMGSNPAQGIGSKVSVGIIFYIATFLIFAAGLAMA